MPKNNSQKGAIEISTISAIIIIAVIVGAVSIMATMQYYEVLNTVTPVTVITPKFTPRATLTPTPETTTSWKIYNDNKIGFEIRYPAEWSDAQETNIENDKLVTFGNNNIEFVNIRKFELQKNQSFKDILVQKTTLGESPNHPDFSQFKLKKIGNENFYYIFPYLSEGQYSVSYWYVKGSNVIQFELYANTQGDWQNETWKVEDQPSFKKLDQILSTFKFANDNDATALKTYKNEKLGISFNYPANATLDNESTNGIIVKIPNGAELNISNLAFGIKGYGTNLPNYPDKEISSGHARTVKGYDSISNNNVLYWILLGKNKQDNQWSASSTIDTSQLNKETINLFDQILATFKILN